MPVLPPDPDSIETMNDHFVGSRGGHVVITFPPLLPMPYGEAIRMAAWIVLVADGEERFKEVLKAIKVA